MDRVPIYYISHGIATVASVLIVPWIAYGLAIVFGFPVTGMMRRMTGTEDSKTIDVNFIMLGGCLLDGLVGVLLTIGVFTIFRFHTPMRMVFILALAKTVYTVWRHDILGMKSDEIFKEIAHLFLYYGGLFLGAQLFLTNIPK